MLTLHQFIVLLFQVMTDYNHAFTFWNSLWALDGECFRC